MKSSLLAVLLLLLGCYRPAANPASTSASRGGVTNASGGGGMPASAGGSTAGFGGSVAGGAPATASSGTAGVTTGGSVASSQGGTNATVTATGGILAGAGGAGTGGNAGSGLPCDVQVLLINRCDSCHGAILAAGAPRSLVSYADLIKPDPANTSMSEAQVALERMQSTTSPMPPGPASLATAAEIAALQNWINSGYVPGSCGAGGAGGTTQAGSGGSSGAGGSIQAGSGGRGAGVDAGVAGGSLPCDVRTLLVNRCDSCHGAILAAGAPRSLASYADLVKPDPANTSMTEAQVALLRMQSTSSPMPPAPASAATAAEIATLQNWINGGYPSGSCGGDAGQPPPDPLNSPATCTSNTTWNQGTEDTGSTMAPGQACISCHRGTEAPVFVIAGTLYPTGHEPNNCFGVNGTSGARVVVAGNNGTSITLTPNSAGNFTSSTALPPPYMVKVVNAAGLERLMSGAASTGDCNSCHTQNGANNAPGRVTLP